MTENKSHSDQGQPASRFSGNQHKRWIAAGAVALIAAAIAIVLLIRPWSGKQEGRAVPAPVEQPVPSAGTQQRSNDVIITLSPDEMENAQFKTEVAIEQSGEAQPTAPGTRTVGTVQSNAYKEVPVLPIAGGIMRDVRAQLGDRVKRGQPLAIIFSNELADAQASYLKMLALSEHHHLEYHRTTQLVEIGAASREELEKATADYKTEQANLASARQRLMLLGMSLPQVDRLTGASQVESLISISAPSSGTVISRTVNPGEVISTGKELFRIADLSSVWVIGQIYETDLASVRVGRPAKITTAAYPARSFIGRVSYIDPRVDASTRTVQVRVEVPNPGEVLKLGMFVDVSFGGAAATGTTAKPAVLVPSTALQAIGTRKMVYVASDRPGVFAQREVSTGMEANGHVTVYGGLNAGERVVTDGSFLLRAESLKLNPGQLVP
jgi:cobalt-zinc-cadmium efflux system membrane fusion protein